MILVAGFLAIPSFTALAENWPCWRGPRGDGTSLERTAPVRWDPAEAIWKTELPGLGHASMVVWDDRLFTVTAEGKQQDRMLLCLDRTAGKLLWKQVVATGPLEKLHPENSHASATPATDGERVYVVFRVGDEMVVAAHDFATGRQLWRVRPGTHVGEWGFCNEPVLYQDKVIVDGDSKGDSFLVALNRADGKVAWQIKRSHKGISYSAPLIRELAGRMQLIQCGDRAVTGFDPDNGKTLWRVDGPSEEFVATPVVGDRTGLVYVSSSWPKQVLLAIRPDGSGDVTRTHVVWRDTKGAPYVPSMIVADAYLLTVNNNGYGCCYDAASGNMLWREKFGRTHASPVLVAGLVHFINDEGEIDVIKPGAAFERIARFKLGERCYASPAISDGQVFLRGFKHLFCFGRQKGT